MAVKRYNPKPAPSTASDLDQGSMRHSDIRRLMGQGGAKAAPAVKQQPAPAGGGSPSSEGQAAVAAVTRTLKRG